MTPGEVNRFIVSRNRIRKFETQDKASLDYILARLIVKGIANCLGDKSPYPTIQEAYPGFFEDLVEEQKAKIQETKTELSALRFKQFAQSYNNRFKDKEVPK